jgi:hypothetical protein
MARAPDGAGMRRPTGPVVSSDCPRGIEHPWRTHDHRARPPAPTPAGPAQRRGPRLFEPLAIRDVTLRNRIMVSASYSLLGAGNSQFDG